MAARERKARGQGAPQVRLATASQWPPATATALTMGTAAFSRKHPAHEARFLPTCLLQERDVCVWGSLLGSPSSDAPSIGARLCLYEEGVSCGSVLLPGENVL